MNFIITEGNETRTKVVTNMPLDHCKYIHVNKNIITLKLARRASLR